MTEQSNWKFIIPKETLTFETHLPNWYQVDVEKLHHQRFEDVAYLFATMVVSKDYEHFDKVKKFLIIPEKPKTLEQIQQELDEKFEKLIEKTHLEYRIGHNWLYKKKRYEEFCKKQDADFEYARENGFFPPKLTGTLDYSNLIATGSNITSSFVIRCGTDNAGYYTIGAGIVKYYMNKKPNWLVRNCAKIFFDFTWKDV
jgi:hypothetical protein